MSYKIKPIDAFNHFGYCIISYDKELEVGSIIPVVHGFKGPCHIFDIATPEEVMTYREFYLKLGASLAAMRLGDFNYKVNFD